MGKLNLVRKFQKNTHYWKLRKTYLSLLPWYISFGPSISVDAYISFDIKKKTKHTWSHQICRNKNKQACKWLSIYKDLGKLNASSTLSGRDVDALPRYTVGVYTWWRVSDFLWEFASTTAYYYMHIVCRCWRRKGKKILGRNREGNY